AFRGRDGIAAKTGGVARRLTAHADAGDRDAELEPDEVKRLVHRGVPAARIGDEAVFGKAPADIVARRLERRIDAPAQVAEHRAAVALERRDHLDRALVMQRAAIRFGLE